MIDQHSVWELLSQMCSCLLVLQLYQNLFKILTDL